MRTWSSATLKSLIVPGGILLLAVVVLAQSGWLTLTLPALSFLYYCALAGGMLLAWRFHSSRIFFALLVLFLAQQATVFFAAAQAGPGTAGAGTAARTVLEAVAVLVPVNLVLIALMSERGFQVSGTAPMALFLFTQSVVVAVVGSAGETPPAHARHAAAAISLPGYALFALGAAGIFLLGRFLFSCKPGDAALLWSLGAFSLFLHFLGSARLATIYIAAAACILAVSIIENSYLLAYHDELTTLPSRRAFNDALLRLQQPYSIAVVDIDHFKRFNDIYGHDTGDEVLRLVAANLSQVTGGGQAYRCGGEEFAILFPGKSVPEVVDHLERLRVKVETAEFRLRSGDRRQAPRGPDRRNHRRNQKNRRARAGHAIRQLAQEKSPAGLSVTVSIGAAASTDEKSHPDLVLEAADKALYKAKDSGRNRVETASSPKRHTRVKTAGIA